MNKKLLYTLIGAATAIILALVWALVFVSSGSNDKKTPVETQVSQMEKTLSGKPIAEDRLDVLNAANALLNSTKAPATEAEFMKLLEKLDTAAISEVPKEFLDKTRFVDTLDDDSLKLATYQSAITFAALSKVSNGTDEAAPMIESPELSVFVDQAVGHAFVPMNIYVKSTGTANTFSLEFVYIDGEWLLAPYSALDQVRLSMGMQEQLKTITE